MPAISYLLLVKSPNMLYYSHLKLRVLQKLSEAPFESLEI